MDCLVHRGEGRDHEGCEGRVVTTASSHASDRWRRRRPGVSPRAQARTLGNIDRAKGAHPLWHSAGLPGKSPPRGAAVWEHIKTPPPSCRHSAHRHRRPTTARTLSSAPSEASTPSTAQAPHYVMNLFASLLCSIAVAVAVADMAQASPTPGKTDAAKIQKNMAKNKC